MCCGGKSGGKKFQIMQKCNLVSFGVMSPILPTDKWDSSSQGWSWPVPFVFQECSSSLSLWHSWPSSSSSSCLWPCTSAGRCVRGTAGRRAPHSMLRKVRPRELPTVPECVLHCDQGLLRQQNIYVETQMSILEHGDSWAQRKLLIWPVLMISILVSMTALDTLECNVRYNHFQVVKISILTLWHLLHKSCIRMYILHPRWNQVV